MYFWKSTEYTVKASNESGSLRTFNAEIHMNGKDKPYEFDLKIEYDSTVRIFNFEEVES